MKVSKQGKVIKSYLDINKENFASFGNLDEAQMFGQNYLDNSLKTDSKYEEAAHLMDSSSRSIGQHANEYAINIQTHTTDRSFSKSGKTHTVATYRNGHSGKSNH